MKTITLEEHYANPEFLKGPGLGLVQQSKISGSYIANLLEQLCDVGERGLPQWMPQVSICKCFR